jgi:hypothetical protein
MLRMIAVAVLLSGTGVALASDASFDQQVRRENATAPTSGGGKSVAPSTSAAPCGCSHAHS